MVQDLLRGRRGAVSLQDGACTQQCRCRIVPALHLRVETQRLLEVGPPLGDQAEIVEGIIDELARGQKLGEIPARRVEIAILKFDQPEEPQGHRLRFRIARQGLELSNRGLILAGGKQQECVIEHVGRRRSALRERTRLRERLLRIAGEDSRPPQSLLKLAACIARGGSVVAAGHLVPLSRRERERPREIIRSRRRIVRAQSGEA